MKDTVIDFGQKLRNFCATLNNYSDDQLDQITKNGNSGKYKYLIFGKEVAKTGTPHLQIYCELKNSRSFDSIRTEFFNAHIEKRKGTAQEAADYCKKEEDYTEYGQISFQGKRSDLNQVREIVKESNSMRKVVEVATSYQSVRMAQCILQYNEPPRPYGRREVHVHWGDTGTGKTYDVYQKHPDVYSPVSFKWWDGYDGQKVVLLDDIRGDFCKFHEMLMLTGERPFRVECKGGSRQAVYDTIYITCSMHPSELWSTIEDKSQFLDRITTIKHYTGDSKREILSGAEVVEQKSGVILTPPSAPTEEKKISEEEMW